jgi:hypothetical protein
MDARTLNDLQFIVADEQQQKEFQSLPVEVSLALLVERPIRTFEVLDIETPNGWVWVKFEPWDIIDPYLPVPTLNYGGEFFSRYSAFALHLSSWSDTLVFPEKWSREGRRILENFNFWLAEEAILLPDTSRWLLNCLWRLWAMPQGPQDELRELAQREAIARGKIEAAREAARAKAARAERERREARNKALIEQGKRDAEMWYGEGHKPTVKFVNGRAVY